MELVDREVGMVSTTVCKCVSLTTGLKFMRFIHMSYITKRMIWISLHYSTYIPMNYNYSTKKTY